MPCPLVALLTVVVTATAGCSGSKPTAAPGVQKAAKLSAQRM